MVETASLVVSEVVTNAVIHARSDAELLLERTPTAPRISVIDHGEGLSQREKTGGAMAAEASSSSKRCRRGGEPSQQMVATAYGPSSRSSRPDLEQGPGRALWKQTPKS
jgi:hypothetical protein